MDDDWQAHSRQGCRDLRLHGHRSPHGEPYNQRTSVPVPAKGVQGRRSERAGGGTYPIAGCEWNHPLEGPHASTVSSSIANMPASSSLPTQRDCSAAAILERPDPVRSRATAQPPVSRVRGQEFSHAQLPAVCNDANPVACRTPAKAYPTIRELRARAPPRAGPRRPRGHHLVALSDSHDGPSDAGLDSLLRVSPGHEPHRLAAEFQELTNPVLPTAAGLSI